MKKENKKIVIILILIALTLVFAGVMSFIACEEANAEYADIILNPQTVVNFNQYVEDNFISFTMQSGSSITFSNLAANAGDKFYYKITNDYIDANYVLQYRRADNNNNVGFYNYLTSNSSGLFTLDYDAVSFNYFSNSSNNKVINFNLINLSVMFGIGNEPNLEQCKNLFTAEYYNYTDNKPMNLGSINAYQQALSDILSSFKYQLKTSAIGLNSFSYKYNEQDAYFQYNEQYGFWYFLNTFASPLFTNIESGVLFTINYNLWGPNSGIQSNLHLAISYIDEQGNFVILKTDTQSMNFYSDEVQSYSFTLPVSVDTLYFSIYNDTTRAIDTEANFFVIQFDILADKLDMTTALTNAYTRGVESQLENYKPGGIGYQVIYNEGYMDATSNPANGSIFTDGWSWIGTMFHAIGEIFSMTLLPGVPLGLFVALPLLLGVIFFVVKVSKGGGE